MLEFLKKKYKLIFVGWIMALKNVYVLKIYPFLNRAEVFILLLIIIHGR
jgi:hypothetical protein